MKFGFRVPSIKKRIAARTSPKRFIRHNLGLKAPRGWGWVTNPKKAAYNRVYNRTTIDVTGTGSSSGGSAGGLGCLILAGAGMVLFAFGVATDAVLPAMAIGLGVTLLVAFLWTQHKKKYREMVAQQQAQAGQLATEREAQMRQARYDSLSQRYGPEAAYAIMEGRYWQGGTMEMVVEAIGHPADVKERVFKTKTKTTYCYNQLAKNRFALKVYFENGVVVGWDQT